MTSLSRFDFVLGSSFAIYLALSSVCFAGGSIGWDEVRPQIAKDDPFLAEYIAKNFEMRPVGGGVRVGHDKDGNSMVPGLGVGTRIPPFEFPAKPLGALGDYTLYITLEPRNFEDGKTTLWVLSLRKKLPTE